jgi:hypothetical protein
MLPGPFARKLPPFERIGRLDRHCVLPCQLLPWNRSARSLQNLPVRFLAERAKPSDTWSSHLDNDSGNRNKKPRVSKVLSSSTPNKIHPARLSGQCRQIGNGSTIYETGFYLS